MIRVLIVDDCPDLRRGLKEALAREPDIELSEAAGPDEALRIIRKRACDLAVLDFDTPGGSGPGLLREIKRRFHFPVLVLGAEAEEQFAVRALNAGAAGFLSKEAEPDDLVKAVRTILGGGRYVCERVAESTLPRFDSKASKVVAYPHETLSDRELQILRLLGAGKKVREIAAEMSLSVPTVSTYRARVMEKMGLKTTAELVRYAIKKGLAH